MKGGTIVTPQDSFEGAVAVDKGKIAAIGSSAAMPQANRSVDASGLFVLPGIIDAHVHFREPGFEYKEDLQTGSTAAAFGGVTTIFDMPNVNPANARREKLQYQVGEGEAEMFS